VLGATFLAAGYAVNRESSLIIDRTGTIGHEFIDCLKNASLPDERMQTEAGRRFLSDVRRRGLIDDNGNVYTAPCAYPVSRMLLDSGCGYFPMTEVLSVKKQDGLFVLTLLGPDGLREASAKTLVQTVSPEKSVRCRLGCIVRTEGEEAHPLLERMPAPGVSVFRMEMGDNPSWEGAREALVRHMQEKGVLDGKNAISLIAPEFEYEYSRPVVETLPDGRILAVSQSFPDPVHAFDMGAKLAQEEEGR